MSVVRILKQAFEYMQGAAETAPPGFGFLSWPWLRGAWWALLAAAVLLFSGQTSKFIYIDF